MCDYNRTVTDKEIQIIVQTILHFIAIQSIKTFSPTGSTTYCTLKHVASPDLIPRSPPPSPQPLRCAISHLADVMVLVGRRAVCASGRRGAPLWARRRPGRAGRSADRHVRLVVGPAGASRRLKIGQPRGGQQWAGGVQRNHLLREEWGRWSVHCTLYQSV